MFELVGSQEFILPVITAAIVAGAAWVGGQRLWRSVSIEGRTARQLQDQLTQLGQATELRLSDDAQSLHGRISGWMVEISRGGPSVQRGFTAGTHWQLRLFADAPIGAAGPRQAPPAGLVDVHRDGSQLVAHLPMSAQAHVRAQLEWMVTLAMAQHVSPSAHQRIGAALGSACKLLGLTSDPVLHRWTGTLHRRTVLVEWVEDRDRVQLHLDIPIVLPQGLWIGQRDHPSGHGDPVPVALNALVDTLSATASAQGANAARELLQDRQLVDMLAARLSDGWGSRVYANQVMLCRSIALFTAAPRETVEQALSLARAFETAVERPWLAFAAEHGLTPLDHRTGGRSMLRGHRHGFRIELVPIKPSDDVRLVAIPDDVRLAPGLQIRAGAGSGRRTSNPILDQHITVEVGPDTPDSMLAALPAEALLPLLLEPSSARIHSGGVEIRLTGPPSLATLAQAIADLERVLPHLPRERTST